MAAPIALGLAALAVAAPSAAAKTLIGTPAADVLVGTSATGDTLFGGGGADTLTGGPGPDIIYGVRSSNTIDAGEGNNYVEGGTGDDTIKAGNGNNTVFGSTGHDTITLGDGNNYVDPGGAPDVVVLGNGNNVINAGGGGMRLTAGSGNNTVYYHSGPDEIVLGGGVNQVYVAKVGQLAKIDCGGNPDSVLFVNRAEDPTLNAINFVIAEGKISRCPKVMLFDAIPAASTQIASKTEPFSLTGTDGPDRLFGGHGGGVIDGKGGNNILWADREPDTGGEFAKSKTTKIRATDGNNEIFGGRGTNDIFVGNGANFIRGGAFNNSISVGSGTNVIRLRGKGKNTVILRGGTAYVEAFVTGAVKPRVRCQDGAKAIIVYGLRKPITDCGTVVAARTARGKRLQILGLEIVGHSDPIVANQFAPGDNGIGVPRPPISAG
ncbi:MAG: hypothetical protein JHD16_02490 [Solirubrobacteraceae bacterium]|nr:hypothetical protein [Solirubrobacteraceae bacterium]